MNLNKIFSNWFYIFLFFWTILAILCLLTIGVTYVFLDEPIAQRTFQFTGFWLTFFSLLTATILYYIRRYSMRYANKNVAKSPLPIDKKNWPIQGLKIGVPGFVLVLIFHWIMGQDITMNSLLFASFFHFSWNVECIQRKGKLTLVEEFNFSEQQYAILTLEADTVNLGDTIRGKMFMSSDELLSISRTNQVNNYLTLNFQSNYKPWGPFTKTGTIKGDTAYFEFPTSSLPTDSAEISMRNVGALLKIRLYPTTQDLDTAFAMMKEYYVKIKR